MNMILAEVWESLKRRKGASCLIGMGVLVFLIIVSILYVNYICIGWKANKLKQRQGHTLYYLSDQLDGDGNDLNEFWDEANSLERTRRFYENLETKLGEKYFYVFHQSIDLLLKNKKCERKFLEGYEEGKQQEPFSEGERGFSYSFKAVQMNQQAFNHFALELTKGKGFVDKDFQHHHHKGVIPVLLGSEYEKFYQVGDQIDAEYVFKEFRLVVKGFIARNTMISTANQPELYLDRYIVMPAQRFDPPVNKEESSFQEKHYLQLVNGGIYSKQKKEVVAKKLEGIKKLSHFPYMTMYVKGDFPYDDFLDPIQENIYWVMIIAMSLFLVCIVSIAILMITKIQDNFKNMSIHLISGATMNQLFQYVVAEVLVTVGLPGLMIIALPMLLGALFWKYMALILICIVSLILLSVIPIYIQFRKLQISQLLKRME